MYKAVPQSAILILLATIGFYGCSHTPMQDSARYIEQGKEFLEKQDYARATLAFRNAAKQDPKNAEAYYQMALTSLAMGEPRTAAAALQKATELNPKHAAAQVKLAELMTTAHSKDIIEDAQKRLVEVLKDSPNNLEALDSLALAEVRLGDANLAEKHFKDALAKFPTSVKTAENLAALHLRRGNRKAAEETIKKLIAEAPQSANPKVLLAEFYRLTDRPAEAEAQYRAALEQDPTSGVALLGITILQEKAGHPEQAEETLKRLSALPDKRYKPVYASYLYQKGKKDAAIAEFERLAQQDPNDRSARTLLVAAYVRTGKTQQAENLVSAALKSNPKDTDALLQRSEMYLQSNRLQEAQNDLNVLLRQRPDAGYIHYLMANVMEARGASLQANQELGEAVRLQPDLLVARLVWANSLTADSPATALKLLDQAPEPQHKSPAYLAQRNVALWVLGDRSAVRRNIDAGLAVARTPELLLQDARLKLSQANYSGAEASLQEALRMVPTDLRLIESLADCYAAQKQNSKALELVRRNAVSRKESVPAQKLLAAWLLKQGDRAGARSVLQTAKDLEPGFGDTDLALAELDITDGKLDAARQRLAAGVAASETNPASKTTGLSATGLSAEVLLGNLEVKAGRLDQAIVHYRRVMSSNPNNTLVMNNLAFLLADYANQPDEALALAQKAKQLEPNNPMVSDTIGWAYYRKGIYRSAVEQLTTAAAKGSPQMKYHLAMAYLKAGERQRGQQVLEEALRLDPSLPEAKTAATVLADTLKGAR